MLLPSARERVKVKMSMTALAVPLHSLARQLARPQQLLATSPPLTRPPDTLPHPPQPSARQ